jgi:hypothetical protein
MAGKYHDGKEVQPFVMVRTYPFFENGFNIPKFNRADFDLWFKDREEAMKEVELKNDIDATTPEAQLIINQIEEKQAAERIRMGNIREVTRDIAKLDKLTKQEKVEPVEQKQSRKTRPTLKHLRESQNVSLDREELVRTVDTID